MASSRLVSFRGMTGVRGSKRGPLVGSPSGFMRAIKTYRVAAAAGDHGSITLWRDDKGALRGEFQRFCLSLDAQTFATQAAAKRWLVEWMPKLRAAP